MTMLPRHISPILLDALADSPVLFLRGARQTGKTTLTRQIASSTHTARYLTFDDATVLAAARYDPDGFIRGLDGNTVIDEVQRVPELLSAIKAAVDQEPRPGRFLLTGSADVLLLPRVSESLAGRMEILTLWPLSQGEIAGVREDLPAALFSSHLPQPRDPHEGSKDLLRRICAGGYPAALARPTEGRRYAWFGSYLTAMLQRDVRDISNVEDLTALPKLLSLVAARSGSLLNFADLSRSLQIPQTTLKRYLTLLETTFLVQTLPAWSANLSKRLVKSPKLYVNDTGLQTYLIGTGQDRLIIDPMTVGRLLENFVFAELRRQATWSRIRVGFFHFRLPAGHEVDFVIERQDGQLVGIDVKASASVGPGDFKGLRTLAELAGDRFQRGIILYTGRHTVSFGNLFSAVPVSALWSTT